MKKRIKKLLAGFLLFLVVFGQVGSGSVVFADIVAPTKFSTISDFDGINGCNVENPETCNCKVLLRHRSSGNVYGFDGFATEDLSNESTVIDIQNPSSYEVAFMLLKPSEDVEDECYILQQNKVDNPSLAAIAIGAGAGCGSAVAGVGVASVVLGAAAPIGLGVTCIGAGVAGAAGSGLVTGWNKFWFGNWHESRKTTVNALCNWTATNPSYTTSPWMNLRNPQENSFLSLEFKGHSNWLINGDEKYYCGKVFSNADRDRFNETYVGDDYSICKTNLDEESEAYAHCVACFGSEDGSGEGGVWTAVGCIDKNPKEMIGKIINIGIGIAGGIALLMILASAFMLTISQGDVKKTSDAKERLTSAIIGLIFIIFSVTILQFIGESVLKIPGFGGS